MREEIEKIDEIRRRTGASYREAYEALQAADGDLVAAIIALEEGEKERGEKRRDNEFYVRGSQLVEKVKEIIKEGNVTSIRIKSQERVIIEFPVTVGVVGTIIAPYLALLGAAAALLSHATIEVERAEEGDNDPSSS